VSRVHPLDLITKNLQTQVFPEYLNPYLLGQVYSTLGLQLFVITPNTLWIYLYGSAPLRLYLCTYTKGLCTLLSSGEKGEGAMNLARPREMINPEGKDDN
jgi:hypothetical protein